MAMYRFGMTDQSLAVIERQGDRSARIARDLSHAVGVSLIGIENHLKTAYFTGYRAGVTRGQKHSMIFTRSASLLQGITHEQDHPFGGYVGTSNGPASKYARMQLGDDTTTIKPKAAKNLWIPVGKNVGPSGQTRQSPRAVMELKGPRGGRLASIVGRGDTKVVFVRSGGNYQRGKKKGIAKGNVMFVLKKEVTVQGSGALGASVEDERSAVLARLQRAVVGGDA